MRPRTKATLDELERAEWFSSVGSRPGELVIAVSSWEEAIASCGSEAWEEVTAEASNRLSEAVARASVERFRLWNEVVVEIKRVIEPLVTRRTRHLVEAHDLPKVFEDAVKWDILHLCVEAEYSDINPPGFYAGLGYWYVRGHFPCGWEGEFPLGKLKVF